MKIAFIVEAFPTISETFILNQITGLLNLGHNVEIYAEFNPHQPKIHSDIQKYRLLKKTFYSSDIVPLNKIKRITKALSRTVKSLYKNPIAIIRSLNFFKFGKKALGFRCLLYTTYLLDKDIIHCHFGTTANKFLFIKDILNVPYITTFHGFDVNSYVEENGKGVYSELFRKGDIFTYNSEATKKKLESLTCPLSLMRKMPMGIKLDQFRHKERRINLNGQIKILSVGRLVEFKGREHSIKAVASIVDAFPSISYKIVGNGPLRQGLEDLIKMLGMQHHIQILGWATTEELINLYEESHIFLHPSITASNGDMESQGLVLLEALASGLPIIATYHNAIPESVIDGKFGFLVKEKDVDALAERLTYLIEHPNIWSAMGSAGRKFVEERFDIIKLNKKLEEIYKDLLN
jgi:colanic acid/amylovoran biosynthesis glycosyltransferase